MIYNLKLYNEQSIHKHTLKFNYHSLSADYPTVSRPNKRLHNIGMRLIIRLHLITCLLFGLLAYTHAENARIAVASNFYKPMKDIAVAFESSLPHKITLSSGSSGQFVAQIQNGAPFDVFLSADQARPAFLEESGAAVQGSRFTYAQGRLVLWAPHNASGKPPEKQLSSGNFNRIARADPKLAPYGMAAQEVQQSINPESLNRTVTGTNVSQAFQFVASGNADLGFIALSQLPASSPPDTVWIIPDTLYSPVLQDAVLLEKGKNNAAAHALMNFLRSESAANILRQYGYHVPLYDLD